MNTANVYVDDLDGIDVKDYPDFTDAYVTAAHWRDTGTDLTEAELNELNKDHPSFIYELVINRVF
jgi:hypothetical protein